MDFVREMAFSEQHIFRYSSRPGTAAARLPDDVAPEVKKRRSAELHALDRELKVAYRSRFLGRTMDVLWEDLVPSEGGAAPVWSGLTDNYLRVFARGEALEGRLTAVQLDALTDDGIRGRMA